MKIVERVRSILALIFLLVALFIGQYGWNWYEHRQTLEKEKLYDRLFDTFYELSFLTNNVVRYPGEKRAKRQWEEKYRSIGTMLKATRISGEKAEASMQMIMANQDELLALYEKLSTLAGSKETLPKEVIEEQQKTVVDKMLIKLQMNASLLQHLVEIHRAQLYEKQVIQEMTLLGVILLVALFLIFAIYRIARGILQPLEQMQEGVARIAGGELGYRFKMARKDELGRLTEVLDMMTEKLSTTITLLEEEVRDHRHAEEDLKKANERLQELDQLKTMFIASMSHELRTPLNSIIGFSGIMLQGLTGEINEKQKGQLERINGAGKHLLDLIVDVIDISKIEAGKIELKPETFFISELVEEVVQTFQPQLQKKGLGIELDLPEMMGVYTDRRRLMQCLNHLLSNAVKFSETGTVSVHVSAHQGRIDISVRDEGIGISESDLPRLFMAFERFDSHLKVIEGGSGLGLYLTHKIATQLLRGTIHVQSSEGEGSVFVLTIPERLIG
ncbi:MAG: ATP-binding protein [Sulfurimonadaceae bacterium]|nr:ATP-binding protein [Sulfurimonadaceae bacterium]